MRILAALLLPILGFSQALTQGERDRALSELQATRKQFLDAVSGLTPAQWNFKPDANTWSVAECAEHITLSEDFLFELITKKIMSSPAAPEKRDQVKGKDESVLKLIENRSDRRKAPGPLVPTHRWKNPEAMVQHFRESRERTLDYVRTTGDALRVHFNAHPAAGLLDGYQWLLLQAGHTARHVAQIAEVKAKAGYPK